jgi:hypothetical protein
MKARHRLLCTIIMGDGARPDPPLGHRTIDRVERPYPSPLSVVQTAEAILAFVQGESR